MENELEDQNITEYELRMYMFVPYNISPIQQGIQGGHAALRYALRYGRNNPSHPIWEFIERYETWIILNGGTTNADRDFDSIPAGTLNQIGDGLQEMGVEFSFFHEPDLNNALTALCFITDERVFNKKDYPDFVDFIINKYHPTDEIAQFDLRKTRYEDLIRTYGTEYKEWIRLIGGVKNEYLRELLKHKKKA